MVKQLAIQENKIYTKKKPHHVPIKFTTEYLINKSKMLLSLKR